MRPITILVTALTTLLGVSLALPTDNKSNTFNGVLLGSAAPFDAGRPLSPRNATFSESTDYNIDATDCSEGATGRRGFLRQLLFCGSEDLNQDRFPELYLTPLRCEFLCHCECGESEGMMWCDKWKLCDGEEIAQQCTQVEDGARCGCTERKVFPNTPQWCTSSELCLSYE